MMFFIVEGSKPENSENNLRSKARTNNKLNPHETGRKGIELGVTINNIIYVSRDHCGGGVGIPRTKGFLAQRERRTRSRTLASYVKTILIDRVYIVRVRPEKEVRYFSSYSVIHLIPFTVVTLITHMYLSPHAIVY